MISNRRGLFRLKISLRTILVFLIIVVLASVATYFWYQNRQLNIEKIQNSERRNNEESKEVLAKLKNIILIDSDTEPTIARIDDPKKLKADNPEFYKNAKKNDYIIIYKEKAIIFRSNDKGKIINIAPIINTTKNQKPKNK